MADINPAQVQSALRGVSYPASRDELIDRARENGAEDEIVDTLGQLPDRTYNGPQEVSEMVSSMDEDEEEG